MVQGLRVLQDLRRGTLPQDIPPSRSTCEGAGAVTRTPAAWWPLRRTVRNRVGLGESPLGSNEGVVKAVASSRLPPCAEGAIVRSLHVMGSSTYRTGAGSGT